MNLSKKIALWLVGSLIVTATTAFGDDNKSNRYSYKNRNSDQGQRAAKTQLIPGYNASSRIDVRGSWDVFLNASFIYWNLSQDTMALALADGRSNADYTTNFLVNGPTVGMDFQYKPGFKIGLGCNTNQDDWDIYSEYTRVHGTDTLSTTGQTLSSGATAPLLPLWGNGYILSDNAYDSGSETWACNLDFVDLSVGRAYYVGTCLKFRTFFGARGAWIIQNVYAQYINTSFSNSSAPVEVPGTLSVYSRSHSWAVGPRIGLDTNWDLGVGIRMFGNANADILYTKYNTQDKTNFLVSSTVSPYTSGQTIYFINSERLSGLRTHFDLELGFGWGTYFDNNNWHVDLAAAYGFHVFFDQNMLITAEPEAFPLGNLYAHGLTFDLRFDF